MILPTAPNTKPPKIIFVDGFNTVGKDYFIKQLQASLNVPSIVTDPRIWLPVFQENKRYWDFIYRPAEENDAIFNAHLHHLRRLRDCINDVFTQDWVLITNRSFLSALNYNFLPHKHNNKVIGGDDDERQRYLSFYQEMLNTSFGDVRTLMVNLHSFHGESQHNTRHENIAELRKRMDQREPGVLMNDFYLDYLIDAYQNPTQQVKQLYNDWADVTSSDASQIVDTYFC